VTFTIVGIGAHMDDCWLGFGATALKALRRGHRVVFVTAVSNPRHLSYLAGRDAEIAAFRRRQSEAVGIRYVDLGHDYMRLVNAPPLVEQVAAVLAGLDADILFCHDDNERNQDHVALGAASTIAAQHMGCFMPLGRGEPRMPAEIYRYTTGWQSMGFAPDVFVDCTDTMFDALDVCSSYDQLYAGEGAPVTHSTVTDHAACKGRTVELTSHSRFKFAQAVVNGGGWSYAEAFRKVGAAFVGSRLGRAVADPA